MDDIQDQLKTIKRWHLLEVNGTKNQVKKIISKKIA